MRNINEILIDYLMKMQIHWFSIFNSFVMLVFLIGLVALILFRTLKKDFIKIARDFDDEEEGLDVIDETGWKQIHGDVFRYVRIDKFARIMLH
jgi:transmembrane 9 superfamily protein 3